MKQYKTSALKFQINISIENKVYKQEDVEIYPYESKRENKLNESSNCVKNLILKLFVFQNM